MREEKEGRKEGRKEGSEVQNHTLPGEEVDRRGLRACTDYGEGPGEQLHDELRHIKCPNLEEGGGIAQSD